MATSFIGAAAMGTPLSGQGADRSPPAAENVDGSVTVPARVASGKPLCGWRRRSAAGFHWTGFPVQGRPGAANQPALCHRSPGGVPTKEEPG